MKHITVLVLSLLFTACASTSWGNISEKDFRRIKVGATSVDVERDIGPPNWRDDKGDGREEWSYQVLSSNRRDAYPQKLIFQDGVLAEIRFDTKTAAENSELRQKRASAVQGTVIKGCSPTYDAHGKLQNSESCDGSAPIK